MNFRKDSHKCMRVAAALFSCLMLGEGVAAAQERPALRIVVVEGEGAINNVQLASGQPLVVQVRGENDEPIAGANVMFSLPDSGPGGTFFGAWKKLNVTTNEEGRAIGTGFRPNVTEGRFQIEVTAAQGDRVGTTNITQSNFLPGQGASRVVQTNRRFWRSKTFMAITAGVIIGAAVAARGGNDDPATTIPGTSVTPGTVSVGTPR